MSHNNVSMNSDLAGMAGKSIELKGVIIYKDAARDIEQFGLIEIAWTRDTLEEFLEDSSVLDIVILGGDVLDKDKDGKIAYTYESWAVSGRSPNESYEAYCARSREKAREYLKIMRKGENVLIIPVLSDEATAGLHSK